jgi:hypothetical protein
MYIITSLIGKVNKNITSRRRSIRLKSTFCIDIKRREWYNVVA